MYNSKIFFYYRSIAKAASLYFNVGYINIEFQKLTKWQVLNNERFNISFYKKILLWSKYIFAIEENFVHVRGFSQVTGHTDLYGPVTQERYRSMRE